MPPRPAFLLLAFSLLTLLGLFTALIFGSAEIAATEVLRALFFPADDIATQIVWQLRLPRALAAFVCGALLAMSGALLQVLLRNPLADPYILGISGGAAVGALGAMLAGWGLWLVNLGSLAGAMLAVAAVFGLSFRSGEWHIYRLLLTGVALSAGCGALLSLMLTLAPGTEVKGMLFWLMGDLSRAEPAYLLPAYGVLAALLLASFAYANKLNVLSLGALKARTLGVAVQPVQLGIYVGASLATVAALLLGGAIGFVGLIIPHLLRLLGITDHRGLMPLSALLGGSFLLVADTLARTVFVPQQLPVGVLTALIGVPLLLLLLSRGSRPPR